MGRHQNRNRQHWQQYDRLDRRSSQPQTKNIESTAEKLVLAVLKLVNKNLPLGYTGSLAVLKLVNKNLPLGYTGSLEYGCEWRLVLTNSYRRPRIYCKVDEKSKTVTVVGSRHGLFIWTVAKAVVSRSVHIASRNFPTELSNSIAYVSNQLEIQIANEEGTA
jgi:hypothetical protein